MNKCVCIVTVSSNWYKTVVAWQQKYWHRILSLSLGLIYLYSKIETQYTKLLVLKIENKLRSVTVTL
jgi:hypothetical protein